MESTPDQSIALSPSLPEVGSASFWSRLKLRIQMRAAYGRHGNSELWHRAVRQNSVGLARKLLENGFTPPAPKMKGDWDQRGEMLFTSLHFLDGEMTEILLSCGAPPDHIEQNNAWDGIAHRAARYGNIKAVNALIAHGADVNLRDGNKFTPALASLSDFLHGQCKVDDRWAIAQAFIAAGADPLAAASHGETLVDFALTDIPARLDWALSLGIPMPNPQESLIELLYSGKEQMGQKTNSYCSATGLARDRHIEDPDFCWDRWGMVALITAQGASFSGVDAQGLTLIERGIKTNKLNASDVAEFVKRGAPLDVCDAAGNTLTHRLLTKQSYANEKGVALYEALCAAGLPDQLAVLNHAGQTPLQAQEIVSQDWYVREAKAFPSYLASHAPAVKPVVENAPAKAVDLAPAPDSNPPLRRRILRRSQ